jgi:NAD+ diphosphatase
LSFFETVTLSQGRWNPGRYSLLAGFLEIGETFEMAVVREVREESGINVDISSVRYDCAPIFPPPSLKEPSLSAECIQILLSL